MDKIHKDPPSVRGFYYLNEIEGLDLNSKEARKIKTIRVSEGEFHIEIPEKLKEMKFIKNIDFSGTDFKKEDFAKLPSSIRQLNLEKCSELDALPENFVDFKNLKNLKLNKTGISDDSLKYLPKNLEQLYLRGCRSIKELPPSMLDLTLLETIDISGTYLSGRDLENLSRSVVVLEASKCKKICEVSIKFKEFSHLKYLDLSRTSISSNTVLNLPDDLEIVDFSQSKIKGKVEFLGKNIRQVKLDKTDVDSVVLDNSKNTLECLSIESCSKINQKDLLKTFGKKKYYKVLECLGMFDQSYIGAVDSKTLKKIKKSYPNIRVKFSNWVNCDRYFSTYMVAREDRHNLKRIGDK